MRSFHSSVPSGNPAENQTVKTPDPQVPAIEASNPTIYTPRVNPDIMTDHAHRTREESLRL